MRLSNLLKALQCACNVARHQRLRTGFDLDIDSPGISAKLDIFIQLDKHLFDTRSLRHKQAAHTIQVLIQETSVQRLDALELGRIEHVHGFELVIRLHRVSTSLYAEDFCAQAEPSTGDGATFNGDRCKRSSRSASHLGSPHQLIHDSSFRRRESPSSNCGHRRSACIS
ncbi:hypothetical protein D3C76_824060 [compost metagenome]